MLRERNEIIAFTRDDIERIIRYVAKERVVGSLFVGKFGEQTIRWLPDGGIEVITKYQEGDWSDVSVPPQIALPEGKKKHKR